MMRNDPENSDRPNERQADTLRYMNIAQGSLEECRYYLILANDLGYGRADVLEEQIDEVARLLAAYSNAIRRNK